jgi:hypothetical protein
LPPSHQMRELTIPDRHLARSPSAESTAHDKAETELQGILISHSRQESAIEG